MTTFSIERSDDQAERLRDLAVEADVTPEELLGADVREWLFRSDTQRIYKTADLAVGRMYD